MLTHRRALEVPVRTRGDAGEDDQRRSCVKCLDPIQQFNKPFSPHGYQSGFEEGEPLRSDFTFSFVF